MKALKLSLAISITLSSLLMADTRQEVVRDASGRILKPIQHQKSPNSTASSTTRDASGQIIGTSTSRPSAGSNTTSTT